MREGLASFVRGAAGAARDAADCGGIVVGGTGGGPRGLLLGFLVREAVSAAATKEDED